MVFYLALQSQKDGTHKLYQKAYSPPLKIEKAYSQEFKFDLLPGVFTYLNADHTYFRIKYLNRPKWLIRFLPPRKQETDNFFNIIPRPKNEIHLLSTANYIL